ncbi:hypothetical protein ACC676_38350, partial [Rhizobium ruizarguesonis]
WDWWTISLIIWVLTLIAVAGSLSINLARRRWRRLVVDERRIGFLEERIVPDKCTESLLSARQIGSFDLCQIRLLGQRKSNAVGRYADSSEDTEQDQQQ